jgi:hypothetical protein
MTMVRACEMAEMQHFLQTKFYEERDFIPNEFRFNEA